MMRYVDEYRLPEAGRALVSRIREFDRPITLMEVCGTHTMAISRAGLRPLLAPTVELVSGPGCPVCVTPERDIDRALAMARLPGVMLATFGDMIRVPGSDGNLAEAAAGGARVAVVYSPLEALEAARRDRGLKVVFLAVGFETTAPAVAATVLRARKENIGNFYVLSMHKLVPPALRTLVSVPDFRVDGFILPGHVSAVIGSEAYRFLPDEFGVPCVIAGFETLDILQGVYMLLRMRDELPAVETEYSRAVRPGGNPRALSVMQQVFKPVDSRWRGLFEVPGSGLALKEEYGDMDAGRWDIEVPERAGDSVCRCGDVLCGRITPPECPLFAGACTPDGPVGPCMVSSEGTCASYYLYCGEE